jgi:MFS family permease
MEAGHLRRDKTAYVASRGIHHPGQRELRRAAIAASVGNLLEWYDFAVYGFLANIIAARFFAPGDPVSALLSSFAVFGIGFLARPLGGVVIGRLADKRGRKPALTITIILMALGTLMIAVLPTYAYIGFWAPALLVVARLVQGFSAGGEWGTATGFLVEWAPHGRRGFYGSLQQCTALAGLLIGSGVSALASSLIPASQMDVWGWRVPFLLGALVGPIGFYVRRNVGETPAYAAQETSLPSSRDAIVRAGRGPIRRRVHAYVVPSDFHPKIRGIEQIGIVVGEYYLARHPDCLRTHCGYLVRQDRPTSFDDCVKSRLSLSFSTASLGHLEISRPFNRCPRANCVRVVVRNLCGCGCRRL